MTLKIFHSSIKMMRKPFFLLLFFLTIQLQAKEKNGIVPGAEQTNLYFDLLRGKNLGIVANQTSTLGNLHLVDSLQHAGCKIKCVFAPEHGFRGDSGNGDSINSSIDETTGIQIISLYGKHNKPDKNDLKGIDLVIFDIQDVGVRFYTYISTLQYVMEACADNDVPLLILDRPNPNGFYIDGPVLEPKYSSFIGMQTIPVVYGMTIGEYASMLDGEGWLKTSKKCSFTIIPVKNYTHKNMYQLPVPPSPNLPDMDAVYLYPSICFFEGTRISLGRGTNKPFRLIGFPDSLKDGITFIPMDLPGYSMNPPYKDTICSGQDLSGEGKPTALKKTIQLHWLLEMYYRYPNKKKFFTSYFDKLAGTSKMREQILSNKSEDDIKRSWIKGIEDFKKIRKKYLKYPDFE
jgi:uncharacterized protein YbbC (DUF1343 family)